MGGRRFRWAELQILELEKCRTEEHIKDALHTIPETLEKTYRKILDGFEKRDVPLARQILIIICLSPVPLDLKTIASMVDLDPTFVLEICTTSLVSEFDDKVRVAHFSVREFLVVSEECGQHHACQFSVREGRIFLATTTVNCLLEQTKLLTKTNDLDARKLPFAFYAAAYWFIHVTVLGDVDQLCPDLQNKINLLFTEPNVYFNWVRMAKGCQFPSKGLLRKSPHVSYTLEYMAVGSNSYPDHILSKSLHYFEPPILLATKMGLLRTIDKLLNGGADPNIVFGDFFSECPLEIASERGYEKIVQMLLDRGADTKIGGKHGSALNAASDQGHEKIVQMLLDRGAEINIRGFYGNALQHASKKGHEKIVQTLLDRGAIPL